MITVALRPNFDDIALKHNLKYDWTDNDNGAFRDAFGNIVYLEYHPQLAILYTDRRNLDRAKELAIDFDTKGRDVLIEVSNA